MSMGGGGWQPTYDQVYLSTSELRKRYAEMPDDTTYPNYHVRRRYDNNVFDVLGRTAGRTAGNWVKKKTAPKTKTLKRKPMKNNV